jgi:predicted Zn-dependent peptidase
MFKKSLLENGITVVMEQMRNVRSVSLGIWVKVGSRNEPPDKNGISHFLEHMFFKGTKKRTASDIAMDIDSLGGELNAFTSKEGTTFYIKVLDEYIDKGIELLTDLFLHSTFPEEEMEREKSVIHEEIKMVEDTPDDYIHDLFSRAVWGSEGLGQPVLGRKETVKAFSRNDLISHIRKYYGVRDTIVACAGNFDAEKLLDMLNRSLGRLRRGSEPDKGKPPVFNAKTIVYSKGLSEVHLCLGIQGIHQASPDRYRLLILNTILGGGLSSRLFQEIREKRGLAYSVYSFMSSYLDTGLWAVYAGTGKRKVNEVIDTVIKELEKLPDTITAAELQRAKEQLKGNLILGLESTSRRMQSIANQEIYYGRYYSPREIIKEIDSVNLESIRDLSRRLIGNSGIALTVLGPVEESHLKVSLPQS